MGAGSEKEPSCRTGPLAYVAWRPGTTTLFQLGSSPPSPQIVIKFQHRVLHRSVTIFATVTDMQQGYKMAVHHNALWVLWRNG
jgi:hypothetical protein